jgi:hypothetical protein
MFDVLRESHKLVSKCTDAKVQLSFPSIVVNELKEMVLTLFQRLTVYLVLMLCTQVSEHTVAICTNGRSSKLAFFACVRIHFI